MDINETDLEGLFLFRDMIEEEIFTICKNDVEYIELYTKYDQMIAQTKLEMISL